MAVSAQWFDRTPPVVRTTMALGQCVAGQGRQLADLVTAGRDTAQVFPLGEQFRAVTERGHQAGQRVHWGSA